MNGVAVSAAMGVCQPVAHAYTNLVAHCSGGVLPCFTVITSDPT